MSADVAALNKGDFGPAVASTDDFDRIVRHFFSGSSGAISNSASRAAILHKQLEEAVAAAVAAENTIPTVAEASSLDCEPLLEQLKTLADESARLKQLASTADELAVEAAANRTALTDAAAELRRRLDVAIVAASRESSSVANETQQRVGSSWRLASSALEKIDHRRMTISQQILDRLNNAETRAQAEPALDSSTTSTVDARQRLLVLSPDVVALNSVSSANVEVPSSPVGAATSSGAHDRSLRGVWRLVTSPFRSVAAAGSHPHTAVTGVKRARSQ